MSNKPKITVIVDGDDHSEFIARQLTGFDVTFIFACDAATQPSAEPVAWITDESLRRLSRGGNSAGSVPVHASRSYVAKTPVYLHPSPADEAVRRDAARYRWLREQSWYDCDLCVVSRPRESIKPGYDCPSDDRLDAAIDAAIAQRGEF